MSITRVPGLESEDNDWAGDIEESRGKMARRYVSQEI